MPVKDREAPFFGPCIGHAAPSFRRGVIPGFRQSSTMPSKSPSRNLRQDLSFQPGLRPGLFAVARPNKAVTNCRASMSGQLGRFLRPPGVREALLDPLRMRSLCVGTGPRDSPGGAGSASRPLPLPTWPATTAIALTGIMARLPRRPREGAGWGVAKRDTPAAPQRP
jgi:hypothetical protein